MLVSFVNKHTCQTSTKIRTGPWLVDGAVFWEMIPSNHNGPGTALRHSMGFKPNSPFEMKAARLNAQVTTALLLRAVADPQLQLDRIGKLSNVALCVYISLNHQERPVIFSTFVFRSMYAHR